MARLAWLRAGRPRAVRVRLGRPRRSPRLGREGAAEDLEARLDELRDEVRRVEAELMNLRADGDVATGAS
jgi:hypothetical protein